MLPTIRISLGLHNLVDDAQVISSFWNKLILKRSF